MQIDKQITIDLNHVRPTDNIRIHVDDKNSVRLALTITKNNVAVSLSNITVKYDAAIAGYLAEMDAVGSTSGSIAYIPITNNMVALPGLLQIDVKFIESNQILYTQTISMTVDKSIIDETAVIDLSGTTIGRRLDGIDERLDGDDERFDGLDERIDDIETELDDFITDDEMRDYVNYNNGNINIGNNSIPYTQDLAGKLSDSPGSVKSGNIASNAVTSGKLASNAVTNGKIANSAITNEKIENGTVNTEKLNPSYLDYYPALHTDEKIHLVQSDGVYQELQSHIALINERMALIPNTNSATNYSVGQLIADVSRDRYFAIRRQGGTVMDGGLIELPTLSYMQSIPSDSYAWYSDHSWDCKLRGSYYLIGNLCVLFVNAALIEGWGVVYYSLPKAALNASGTVAVTNDINYSIVTDELTNISVLKIKRIDGNNMPSGQVFFTLIYRYR